MRRLNESAASQAEFLKGDILREFLPGAAADGIAVLAFAQDAVSITHGPICTFFSKIFGCKKPGPTTRDPTICPSRT